MGVPALVRRLVGVLGGRYSAAMGIDVDGGAGEVERWFLAATLFGTRISARIVQRTFAVFDRAGVRTVPEAGRRTWEELVGLLDEGGYVRYDFRTATRLKTLARVLDERFGGRIATLGATARTPRQLEAALDELPGWGPVTVRLFLRELRGVWPAADPEVDGRATWAAEHLGLPRGPARGERARLRWLARRAGVDVRDLEAALVRLALEHPRPAGACPGRSRCAALGSARA